LSRADAIDADDDVNHDRWLVSYADFMTLLMAFFVVMYSISQVSEEKYRILTETLMKPLTFLVIPTRSLFVIVHRVTMPMMCLNFLPEFLIN